MDEQTEPTAPVEVTEPEKVNEPTGEVKDAE